MTLYLSQIKWIIDLNLGSQKDYQRSTLLRKDFESLKKEYCLDKYYFL